MSRLATMGASSCATIAVSGFKREDQQLNEQYNANPSDYKEEEGMTVDEFYDDVLYPTRQDLGRTKNYPFDLLMSRINDTRMKDKFIIAVVNQSQYGGGYWPKVLEKHGFSLIDKTNNNIGSVNYIYTRNLARVK